MPALPYVAVGLMAYGMVQQQSAAEDAKQSREQTAAEQRAQFVSQQRIADIKNARERAQIVRQARIARGQILNTGANTGTTFSSGVQGGMGSVSSQGSANQGVFTALQSNQADIISSQSRDAGNMVALGNAQGNAAEAQSIFNLGTSIFGATGGFKNIFDVAKKP